MSVLRCGVEAVLGGHHDRLVEGPDRRRVDVSSGQVVQGEPELDRHREEVGILMPSPPTIWAPRSRRLPGSASSLIFTGLTPG